MYDSKSTELATLSTTEDSGERVLLPLSTFGAPATLQLSHKRQGQVVRGTYRHPLLLLILLALAQHRLNRGRRQVHRSDNKGRG